MGTRKHLATLFSLALALLFVLSLRIFRQQQAIPERISRNTTAALDSPMAGEAAGDEDRLPEVLKGFYRMDPSARRAIMRAAYEASREGVVEPATGAAWVSVGPSNGAGKMNAFAFDPTNGSVLYSGGDDGGVWKSTDAGSSWFPLTDSIPAASVTALAIADSSSNVLYAAVSGVLIKSSDAGATWTFPPLPPGGFSATHISVHPNDSQDLTAALSNNGIFRSTDGGGSWSHVLSAPYTTVYDLVRDPQDPSTLYAAAQPTRILKSTDGGISWAEKSSGPPSWGARFVLAIAPSDPMILYASTIESPTDPQAPSHIFKTTDGGESWVDLPSVFGNSNYFISHFLSSSGVDQAYRNSAIAVSPADSRTVFAAGIQYIRSTDGGATWDIPPFLVGGQTGAMHPDAVDMRYNGRMLWIGNDGGVWSTPDNGQTASEDNNRLITRQVYSLAITPLDRNLLLSGTQDNGTSRHEQAGSLWQLVFPGDGFDCAIDPTLPSTAFVTNQYGKVWRTRSLTTLVNSNGFREVTPPYSPGEAQYFNTLLRMDPQRPSILFVRSIRRIWHTTDGGTTWSPLSTQTTDGSVWDPSANIIDLAIAPSSTNVLMVSLSGWAIFRSTDSGATWAKAGTPPVPLTALEFDPTDEQIAYALGQYFFDGQLRNTVFMTTDAGQTWTTRNEGLPSVPLGCIRVDPADPSILYCGTMVGIYQSTDRGETWNVFGSGFPSATPTDLRLSDDGSLLWAGTFGRGVWQIQVHPPLPPRITGATVAGKQLIVAGAFFDSGAAVLLNGQRQRTRNDANSPRTQLVAKKAGKKIKPGDMLQVRNPDGSLSAPFQFASGQ